MRVYTGGVEERKTDHMAPMMMAAEMPSTTTTTTTTSSYTSTGSKVGEGGRLPSIEMEPKTLTLDQIKYAREAALDVVSTKSEEEAIRIFTAGLKPMQLDVTRKSGSSMDSSDDDVDLDGSYNDGGSNTGAGRCCGGKGGRRRGRRPSFFGVDDARDVATAPF